MKLYAQHIMTTDLIVARPEMQCDEVASLLIENRISGAPVVDSRGALLGVVSMTDILKSGISYYGSSAYFEEQQIDRLLAQEGLHLEPLTAGFVSDFMSRDVCTVHPNTPVEAVAKLMSENRVHRVIVVNESTNEPIGLISTFDLLKLIATCDTLESELDACGSWYSRKFSQMKYETIPTLK